MLPKLRFRGSFLRIVFFVFAAAAFLPLSGYAQNRGARPESQLKDISPGLSLAISQDGSYSISSQNPLWTFAGSVGGPVDEVVQSLGSDGIGRYQKWSFRYASNGVGRRASVRTYVGESIVVFGVTFLAAGSNAALFPRISSYPQGLYKFGFNFTYGYQYGPWGEGADSPWAYFDSSGNSFIVSPASHFPLAATVQDSENAIVAGINSSIQTLPAGFTQETILVVGKGINKTWDKWGQAMTDLQGKVRPRNDADASLKSLGYWTDSASSYYYCFNPALGYEGTLMAVKDHYASNGIPLSSLQLDSWWYPKGSPPSWSNSGDQLNNGQYLLRPDQTILPDGLGGFQNLLGGIPLIVHARWLDPSSPLRQQYTMSGNVSTDRHYWNDLAAYLKTNGVMTYEQDWLASLAQPEMNLTDPEAYLDNMAQAMANTGVTLQYCGQSVAHFLQGSKYSNLTTARVSQDGFNRSRWDPFLYNSRLASALGIFPFADNVYSTDIKSLLLETMSAGMVGVGDALGKENVSNIMQSIRPDGVVVKPDEPIAPMDSTYVADAQAEMHGAPPPPMLASTFSNHDGHRTSYVFAYSRAADGSSASIQFSPAELGALGQAYVFDYFAQTGQLIEKNSTFSAMAGANGSYFVVAPIGPSGIALLGDTGKFASLGVQRIPEVHDDGVLSVSVQFADREQTTTLQGYSPTRPLITVHRGAISQLSYDTATHLFTVIVVPGVGNDHLANLSISVS